MDNEKKLSSDDRRLKNSEPNSKSSSSQTSASDSRTYEILVALAKPQENQFTRVSQAELFYEQILDHAGRYAAPEILDELRKIDNVEGDPRNMARIAALLQKVLRQLQNELDESHMALAHTEMLIGISQQRARNTEVSVKTLRSAVTRFQQCDDDVDLNLFAECLCSLATSYRDAGNFEGSRTCIKQAYRLLEHTNTPLRLQCLALEELAADLLCENRFKPAIDAYERVVLMKSQLLNSESTDIVRPLIQLGISHFAAHQLDSAEHCLIKAGEVFHKLKYRQLDMLIQILDALSGTMRHKGQFIQADLLEEGALELRGRSNSMGGHALYGNLLKDAQAAEVAGNVASAKGKYRQALMTLEGQRLKRAPERLQILAKLLLLTGKGSAVQRSSLFADIEDCVRAIFCGVPTDTFEGIKRMGLIYELCGKKEHATNLKLLYAELLERVAEITKSQQSNRTGSDAIKIELTESPAVLQLPSNSVNLIGTVVGFVQETSAEQPPVLAADMVDADDAEEI